MLHVPVTSKKRLTLKDQEVWAAYTRQVAPLPRRSLPDPPVVRDEPPGDPMQRPTWTTTRRPALALQPPLAISVRPGGLDNSTWNRFRSGKLMPARTLDL